MTVEEDRAKLKHLIRHWVEHNRSHEASYTEWAERAREMEEAEAADLIEIAVEQMQKADKFLQMALEALK